MKLWQNPVKNPDRIPHILRALYPLPPNFSLTDLCCGYGEVLQAIWNEYPHALLTGVDIVYYPEWKNIDGVRFLNMSMQKYLEMFEDSDGMFHVIMMLETFRNWPDGSENVKAKLRQWLEKHAKYFLGSVSNLVPTEALGEYHIGHDGINPLFLVPTYKLDVVWGWNRHGKNEDSR